jgi:hypothetical protein
VAPDIAELIMHMIQRAPGVVCCLLIAIDSCQALAGVAPDIAELIMHMIQRAPGAVCCLLVALDGCHVCLSQAPDIAELIMHMIQHAPGAAQIGNMVSYVGLVLRLSVAGHAQHYVYQLWVEPIQTCMHTHCC